MNLMAMVASGVLRGVALAVVVALVGFVVGTPLGAAAALARGRIGALRRARVRSRAGVPQLHPRAGRAERGAGAVPRAHRGRLRAHGVGALRAPGARPDAGAAGCGVRRGGVALGRGRGGILVVHVVPNLLGVVAVQLGSTGAAIVVSEAALAFVGLGPRDGVSLGGVLDQGVAAMLRAPHVLVVGAVAVALTSAAMLIAGRAAER